MSGNCFLQVNQEASSRENSSSVHEIHSAGHSQYLSLNLPPPSPLHTSLVPSTYYKPDIFARQPGKRECKVDILWVLPTQTLGVPGRARMQTPHDAESAPCPFQYPHSTPAVPKLHRTRSRALHVSSVESELLFLSRGVMKIADGPRLV